MSPALEYLNTQQLFWINLDDELDRQTHMQADVVDLFWKTTRVSGIRGTKEITPEECNDFVTGWRELWDNQSRALPYGSCRLTTANKPPGQNFRLATQQANIAIKRSMVKALLAGLDRSHRDRTFFVGEDDIAPRKDLFNGFVPVPPADADVAIWSGGLPMAAVTTDDKHYAAGRELTWKELEGRECFNCLGAGLYEVTDLAAMRIVESQNYPMSFDHAWGIALQHLRVYRLTPNAFAQTGPSIRNSKDRVPVLDRE